MLPSDAPAVVLTTLNAKYIHASLGLRYLLANMGALRRQTVLWEFTIARKVPEVALWEALRALHSKSCAARQDHRVEHMMGAHLRPQHICRRQGSTQTRS